MIVLILANVKIPAVVATFVEPLANANSFVAMLMVGMLMDLPDVYKRQVRCSAPRSARAECPARG